MTRKTTKKWKVDTVYDRKRGVRVDLFVDPNDGMFWARYPGGIEHEESTKAELVRKVVEAIVDAHDMEWQRVICVKLTKPFYDKGGCYVGFVFDRHWVSKSPNGTWFKRRWADPGESSFRDDDDEESGKFAHNWRPKGSLIAWTPTRWASLEALKAQVNDVRSRLQEVMEDPAEFALRLDAGALALPGPK